MNSTDRGDHQDYIHTLLREMIAQGASDLFITADFPPAFKHNGRLEKTEHADLDAHKCRHLAHAISSDKQWKTYTETLGANFAIAPADIGRFRVNIFTQQGNTGMVLRRITTNIPDFDQMGLPPVLKKVIMEKRGLVLLVGGTGSGKSTTLAAMLGLRNKESYGHIITIEDPVEYVHAHGNCIITHREVGVDTVGWFDALKDTLRQAPDVILIGEIRDQETMEYALNFAETGHLCVATLHANNANQAIDRIASFFPIEKREKVLNDLSINMKGIISQRLIRKKQGGRVAAVEILLNTATAADAIKKGDSASLKTTMTKSVELGMKTFDQCLFDLYQDGIIELHEAEVNADGKNDLRLRLKLESSRFREEQLGGAAGNQTAGLSLE